MIYRMAGDNDAEVLSMLRWEFKTEGIENEINGDKKVFLAECTDFLRLGLINGDWNCWVAEDEGEIVSQIFIKKIRKIPKPSKLYAEYGYVSNVYTRPAYREKGIGKQLMKHVKQWAFENKLEFLLLWPTKRAVPFYEREGFARSNEVMELILEE